MSHERSCPIAAKVSEATDLITSLELRVRALEDVLDNPNLPDEQRTHIEKELIDIKSILDKDRDILKGFHKENTKSFMVAAAILFMLFLLYGFYCIMYNNY